MQMTTRRGVRLVHALALSLLFAVATMPAAVGQEPQQAAAAQAQQATGRAFEPQDWYKVKALASPAMSPDGKHVAVQVTTVVEAEERAAARDLGGADRAWRRARPLQLARHRQLEPELQRRRVAADLHGGTIPARRDALGGPDGPRGRRVPLPASSEGSRRPGRAAAARVALVAAAARRAARDNSFVVTTGVEGQRGRGGGPGRGGQGRGGAADDDPYAKMEPMAKPPAGSVTKPLDPERFDGMHITDTRYKANGRGFIPSTRRQGGGRRRGGAGRRRRRSAARADPDRPARRQRAEGHHEHGVLAPERQRVARRPVHRLHRRRGAAARRRGAAIRDEIRRARHAAGARGRDAPAAVVGHLRHPGGRRRAEAHPVAGQREQIRWSPDARWLAFNATMGPFTGSDLFVADVAAATTRNLTGDLRADPGAPMARQRRALLMQLNVGGRNALVRVDPRTGAQQEVLSGRRRMSGFTYDKAQTKVAYVATSVDRPTELFVANIDGSGERQLTKFNEALNVEIAWSPRRAVHLQVGRRLRDRGWLMKPHGYEEGRRIRSCSTSTAGRTRRTARTGSTSSRTSRAPACGCSTRTRADRAGTAALHLLDARTLGLRGLRGPDEGGGHRGGAA
jgi:hypothetical protein